MSRKTVGKPGDAAEQGYLDQEGLWRYKTEVLSASISFPYKVTAYRVRELAEGYPERKQWDEVGDELAVTLWGARWAARKIRRRHVRRFGP